MFSFADLITPVTTEEARKSVYDVLGITGVSTTSWKPGAVVRTMITAWAIGLNAFSQLQASIARSGFLELSAANWLTMVAHYVYNVDRIDATFATGTYRLTNSGGGAFPLVAVGDLVVTNPTTGKSYRNTEIFTLDPLGQVDVAIEAVEAGSASTSTPGAISELETTMIGVTGTNLAAVVGLDAETDPLLRARCYEKLGALSPNGPWDAYSYVARTAKREDGSVVGVTRVRVTKDGFGNVNVYCATATGGVTAPDVVVLNEAMQQNSTPLAVTLNTFAAADLLVPITYQLWMYNTSGLTEDQIKDAVALKLATFTSSQPVGGNLVDGIGRLYVDAIRTVIGSALPQIFHVVVTLPAADQILGISQVPVLSTVLGTVNQVAPPDGGLA